MTRSKTKAKKPRKGPATLSPKQKLFVAEYLVDLNATQAAIRAGYSERTAYSIGQENLKKPEIVAAIQAAMNARAQRTEITADRVLGELAKIGFADIRKAVKWRSDMQVGYTDPETEEQASMFTNSVRLVDSHELDDDTAAAIASVSQTDKGGLKITFHDKKGALEAMGRHLGIFNDKLKVEVSEVEKLTDDELDEYIRRHAAEAGEDPPGGGAKGKAAPH